MLLNRREVCFVEEKKRNIFKDLPKKNSAFFTLIQVFRWLLLPLLTKVDQAFLCVFYECLRRIFIFLKKKWRKLNGISEIRFNFIPRKNTRRLGVIWIDKQNQIFIWQKKRIVRKLVSQNYTSQYHCRLRHTTIQYTTSLTINFFAPKYVDTEGVSFFVSKCESFILNRFLNN